MRGSVPGGYVMGGYDSSRGGYGSGAVRGTRELYDPYRQLHRAGPSPVVPATILGVISFMTAMPYLRTPDMGYYGGHTAVRASSFPMPLLWIPVVAVITLQFFGASDWYHGVYIGDRYGARPSVGHQAYSRGRGWWPWSSWNYYPYNRYNTHQHRGLLSTFMDYGGHWLLILLGIAVFTLVSSSSAPTPRVPTVPLAPRTLGFPWSWFF
jgi:hypothetical protein